MGINCNTYRCEMTVFLSWKIFVYQSVTVSRAAGAGSFGVDRQRLLQSAAEFFGPSPAGTVCRDSGVAVQRAHSDYADLSESLCSLKFVEETRKGDPAINMTERFVVVPVGQGNDSTAEEPSQEPLTLPAAGEGGGALVLDEREAVPILEYSREPNKYGAHCLLFTFFVLFLPLEMCLCLLYVFLTQTCMYVLLYMYSKLHCGYCHCNHGDKRASYPPPQTSYYSNMKSESGWYFWHDCSHPPALVCE